MDEMKEEIEYIKEKQRKRKNILNFLIIITFISSLIIVLNVYLIPIYEIRGKGMEPTFTKNDIVAVLKSKNINRNDIVAFDYNGKILVKRVIGIGGDIVNISEDGIVSINEEPIAEDYAINLQEGIDEQEYPYMVPAGTYFVLSDNRDEKFDSRNLDIGPVAKNKIIGKIKVVVWPVKKIKFIEG